MDAASLVFIDETGASTSMVRHYGWHPRGERLVDAAPHGHWHTTTFVAGLRATGLIAPFVLDGPMTGEVFRAYVEQFLPPALAPRDVVVMLISARTRLPELPRQSLPPGQAFCIFQPTVLISTRSSRCSPS